MIRPIRQIILLVTLLACTSLPSFTRAESPSRPNIIFIFADDLGYGDVQCLNPQRGKIPTPHLDRLASQGMTFTDAHSGSSVCTPTRYGLLTGRYSWRTRLQKGVLDGGNDDPLIAEDRLTVASFLRQQGYNTACIGKWHLGFTSETSTLKKKEKQKERNPKTMGRSGLPMGARIIGGPIRRGFDHFWGCSNARTMSSLIVQDRVTEELPTVDMLPRLTQRAVEYLDEQAAAAKSGKPFFLYVPLTSPHTPIVPSAEWQGKSGLGKYADFVMQTDASVGSILAALDRHQLAENTLVFFSADNGCSPQADTASLEKQGHFASAQYRGYKSDIWEGGHRVPFFARWPGTIPAAAMPSSASAISWPPLPMFSAGPCLKTPPRTAKVSCLFSKAPLVPKAAATSFITASPASSPSAKAAGSSTSAPPPVAGANPATTKPKNKAFPMPSFTTSRPIPARPPTSSPSIPPKPPASSPCSNRRSPTAAAPQAPT